MDVIAFLSIGALALYLVLLSTKLLLIRRYVRLEPSRGITPRGEPAVDGWASALTIAQPILSGDPMLETLLTENLRMLPKTTTFLWLIDKSDVRADEITSRIRAMFPNASVIECDVAPPGINPKAWKLQFALERCATEFFVVMDDDTRIDTSVLLAVVNGLQSHDLYTGLPQYRSDGGMWSNLVSHFVNNNAVTTYVPLLNFFPPISINGMFYACRTEALRGIGGFTPIQSMLCDDYAMKLHAVRHGWRIQQGLSTQWVQTTVKSCREYFRLMHRWMLFANELVADQPLGIRATLIVFLGLPPLLLLVGIGLAVIGIVHAFTEVASPAAIPPSLFRQSAVVAAIFSCFALGCRHLLLKWSHRLVHRSDVRLHFITSLVAEFLQPVHLLHAACVRVIRWRGRVIRVRRGQQFDIVRVEPR